MKIGQRISSAAAAFRNPINFGGPKAIENSEQLRQALTDGDGRPEEVAAVLRCVDLLSASTAMLPMRPVDKKTRQDLEDHHLYDLLMYEPNNYLTAFELKRLMERRRQSDGVAYALIVKVGDRAKAIHPLNKSRVTVTQNSDWSLKYMVTRPGKTAVEVPASQILHLRDILDDEVNCLARMKLARRAITTSQAAENAQRNIFTNGALAKGMLAVEGALSDTAFTRLKADIEKAQGPDSAGRFMLGEQGMKYIDFGMTGRDAQTQESRAHSIEDVARIFGVPRPLLMMDDTSWGSGIEQLATLFVRFGLAPSLFAWEQSVRRVLLTTKEKRTIDIDIDERLLLRGSLKDQSDFFKAASGSGGHIPWLHRDEIRNKTGEAPLTDAQKLEMETPRAEAKPAQP